jgi:hypothetical protein
MELASAVRLFIKRIALAIVRFIVRRCYAPQYLRGHLFEGTNSGWALALRFIVWQRVLGYHRHVPWPMPPHAMLSDHKAINFDPEWWDIFIGFGVDYQNFAAPITVGRGTYVAAGVTFVTANHDPEDPSRHLPGKPITVGENCWLGTRAVLLPGVVLGDRTTVGAGAVVTQSFPDGHCIVAGVPARVLRVLPSHVKSVVAIPLPPA